MPLACVRSQRSLRSRRREDRHMAARRHAASLQLPHHYLNVWGEKCQLIMGARRPSSARDQEEERVTALVDVMARRNLAVGRQTELLRVEASCSLDVGGRELANGSALLQRNLCPIPVHLGSLRRQVCRRHRGKYGITTRRTLSESQGSVDYADGAGEGQSAGGSPRLACSRNLRSIALSVQAIKAS